MGHTRAAQVFRSKGLHPLLLTLSNMEWRVQALDGPLTTELVNVFQDISTACGGGKARRLNDRSDVIAIDISKVPASKWYAFIRECMVRASQHNLIVLPIVRTRKQSRKHPSYA